MRFALYSVICGGLITGTVLGYAATRPLVAAFDASDAASTNSKAAHANAQMRGTIRALSSDGYIVFETRDVFTFARTVSILGKIDNAAQIPLLHVGDHVAVEIARSPGSIHFTSITILPSNNSSKL